MPVTSSGSEVPTATMERPMIMVGIPRAVAIETPEVTSIRLPRITMAIPTIKRTIDFVNS